MEASIQTLEVLEVETLANELQQRMGRELTRRERFYLTLASAYSGEDRTLPQDVAEQQRRPS